MFRKKLILYTAAVLTLATLLSAMSFASAVKTGTVTALSGLRVRAAASTSSAALGVLPKGSNVVILEDAGDWYKIEYNNKQAYVSAAYVETSEIADKVMAGQVTASYLNLRAGATTYSAVLGGAPKNSHVIIIGTEGNWYKVIVGGKTGYMSAEYIVPYTETKTEMGYGRVVTSGNALSMRLTPVNGYVIATIPKDEVVEIIGVKDGWYRVTYKNRTGYVSPSYVLPISEDEILTPEQKRYQEILEKGNKIVAVSKKYLGIMYVWGGSTPTQGFDCSGFTQWVFKECGITLKYRTQQYLEGEPVTYNELMPGDLVFFRTNGGSSISHVGIYVGNGNFIHAPTFGKPVQIESMATGFYRNTFAFGRRYV